VMTSNHEFEGLLQTSWSCDPGLVQAMFVRRQCVLAQTGVTVSHAQCSVLICPSSLLRCRQGRLKSRGLCSLWSEPGSVALARHVCRVGCNLALRVSGKLCAWSCRDSACGPLSFTRCTGSCEGRPVQCGEFCIRRRTVDDRQQNGGRLDLPDERGSPGPDPLR